MTEFLQKRANIVSSWNRFIPCEVTKEMNGISTDIYRKSTMLYPRKKKETLELFTMEIVIKQSDHEAARDALAVNHPRGTHCISQIISCVTMGNYIT